MEEEVRPGDSSNFRDKRDSSIFNEIISLGRMRLVKKRKENIETFWCSEEAFVCGLTTRMNFDMYLVFQVGLKTGRLVLGEMEKPPPGPLSCLLHCYTG